MESERDKKKVSTDTLSKFLKVSSPSTKVVTMSLYEKNKELSMSNKSPKSPQYGNKKSSPTKVAQDTNDALQKAEISEFPQSIQNSNSNLQSPKSPSLNSIPKYEPITKDTIFLEANSNDKQASKVASQEAPTLHKLDLLLTETDTELVNMLKSQLAESKSAHEELYSTIDKNSIAFNERVQAIIKEKEDASEGKRQTDLLLKERDLTINQFDHQLKQANKDGLLSRIGDVSKDIKLQANQPELVKKLHAENEAMKNEQKELLIKYNEALNSISKEREDFVKASKLSSNKISDLTIQLSESKKKIDKLEIANAQINEENAIHKKDIGTKNDQINILQTQLKGMQNSEEKVKEYEGRVSALMQQFVDLSKKMADLIAPLKKGYEEALEKVKLQGENISTLTETLIRNEANIKSLTNSIHKLNTKLQEENTLIAKYKDQLTDIESIKQNFKLLDESNNAMRADLQKTINDYNALNVEFSKVLAKSLKLDKDNDILIEKYNAILSENCKINKTMAECSSETEKLRGLLALLRSEFEAVQKYQPALDDMVDMKLAECINKRIESKTPIEIPFIRQGKGVYTFGTLKILLKLEMDTLIARVGGGYMPFEEFIKASTPQELDKIKRSATLRSANAKNEIVKKSLNIFDEEKIVSPKQNK